MALTDPWPTKIDARLFEDLEAVGRLGRSETGGVSRVAFTPEFLTGRDLVRARMADEGLTTWVDGAGNLFGRFGAGRPGQKKCSWWGLTLTPSSTVAYSMGSTASSPGSLPSGG